jgi:hypothetical protein
MKNCCPEGFLCLRAYPILTKGFPSFSSMYHMIVSIRLSLASLDYRWTTATMRWLYDASFPSVLAATRPSCRGFRRKPLIAHGSPLGCLGWKRIHPIPSHRIETLWSPASFRFVSSSYPTGIDLLARLADRIEGIGC